jgi:hypothetical protein
MDEDQKETIRKVLIVDLRGIAKPIVIQNSMRIPFIRTFKDEDKEILRVFIFSEESNTISCHSFTNTIETVVEAKFSPLNKN